MMKGVENGTRSDNTLLDLVFYVFIYYNILYMLCLYTTIMCCAEPAHLIKHGRGSHRPSCQGPQSEDGDCIPDMWLNLFSIHTDVFKLDPDFLENEEKYKTIKKGVLA